MKIAGFQKTTLQDFPSTIASILFTQGCNFRCGYCHNPNLIPLDCQVGCIDPSEIFAHLKKRKNVIKGIVLTGGEPTIQPDLIDFIIKIKKFDLKIKLDTNGSNPKILQELINKNLLDYIAMDYKYPLQKYKTMINKDYDLSKITLSKDLIIKSKILHEFRVTVIEPLFSDTIIKDIGLELKEAQQIILQSFKNEITYDYQFGTYSQTTQSFLTHAKKILDDIHPSVSIRS